MRLEWVRPAGPGPLPAVIVHPEAGHQAAEMRGVLHDLAKAGYLAAAADYQRRTGTRWRESLFPWRDPADPRRIINRVRARPDVDPRRIGLLGFSQGGVFSLLIAAYDGGAAAVVAYYPVTDFESWLEAPGAGLGRQLVFRLIRVGFRRASGARSDAELQALLRRASPLHQVGSIKTPCTPRARRSRQLGWRRGVPPPGATARRAGAAGRAPRDPRRRPRLQLPRPPPGGPRLGRHSGLPRPPLAVEREILFAFALQRSISRLTQHHAFPLEGKDQFAKETAYEPLSFATASLSAMPSGWCAVIRIEWYVERTGRFLPKIASSRAFRLSRRIYRDH